MIETERGWLICVDLEFRTYRLRDADGSVLTGYIPSSLLPRFREFLGYVVDIPKLSPDEVVLDIHPIDSMTGEVSPWLE